MSFALTWFTSLSLVKKIIFTSLSAFCLALIIVLPLLHMQNQNLEKFLIQQTQLLKNAQEKERQAEAVLIFNDKTGAASLLYQAESFLEQIFNLQNQHPSLKKKNKITEQTLELEQNIAQQKNKIDGINQVDNLESLAVDISLKNITGIGQNFYTFQEHASALESEQVIALLNSKPDLIIFDPKKNTRLEMNAKLPFNNAENIVELANYKSYVYLLDQDKKQIFKCARILSGFGACKEWLTPEAQSSLQEPVSMAIDGEIYVLEKNGQIKKFLRSQLQEFELDQPSKLIKEPVKIFTSLDLAYLYILEPKQNRVLVYNKDGELQTQHINEKFSKAQGIWVNDNDKKIYILANGEVLIFDNDFK